MKTGFTLFFISWVTLHSAAQVINPEFTANFGINVNINYDVSHRTAKETFPGIRAFVGFQIYSRVETGNAEQMAFNLSTNIGIYNKSLGNSLNLGFQDNQIDWTTTFAVAWLSNDISYDRLLQSINNLPFYNLRHDGSGAAMLGVNFIMNNNGRNQTNGFVGFTGKDYSFVYYNDGGPGIKHLALGDRFDRYWTGGLSVYWHKNDDTDQETGGFIPYNVLELYFDQFTGFSNQMWEISRLFGIDIQDYDVYRYSQNQDDVTISTRPESSGRKQSGFSYNASSYQARFFWGPQMGVSAGILGSLRGYRSGRVYGLQDFLHIMKGDPLHPNTSKNRIFLGLNYQQNL